MAQAREALSSQPRDLPATSRPIIWTAPRPSLDDMDMGVVALAAARALPAMQYFYLQALERTEIWRFQGGSRDLDGVIKRRDVKLTKDEGRHILRERGLVATLVDQW